MLPHSLGRLISTVHLPYCLACSVVRVQWGCSRGRSLLKKLSAPLLEKPLVGKTEHAPAGKTREKAERALLHACVLLHRTEGSGGKGKAKDGFMPGVPLDSGAASC